jgi:hypothetical protein
VCLKRQKGKKTQQPEPLVKFQISMHATTMTKRTKLKKDAIHHVYVNGKAGNFGPFRLIFVANSAESTDAQKNCINDM